jgi:hypothetical protein
VRSRWLLAAGTAALALVACARASRDPLLTYFNADHGLSLRHPWHWSSDQADQDGVWYRYFQSPPDAARGSVTVTLLVSPLAGSLDDYARTYLAGAGAPQVADEARPGLAGRGWRYASADGATRHRLLLLRDAPGGDAGRVVGLHAEGAPALLEANAAFVDEMFASLAAERAELYREYRDPKQGFALRLPPSWTEARHFGGADQALVQFTTPALAADRTRQTVHGSLTVTSERVPPGTTQRSYYDNGRLTLGEALQVVVHGPWKSGFVDSVRAETSVASARQKRYVIVAGGRGFSLVFEAREDAFHRMARWCDLIAATFRADGEPAQP